VDRVVDGWADLELEIPGPNGGEFLQDVVHTWIFWPKVHIRIMQQPPCCHTRVSEKIECISYVCQDHNFTHMIDK
jgi:hypothetical protein